MHVNALLQVCLNLVQNSAPLRFRVTSWLGGSFQEILYKNNIYAINTCN